MGAVTWRNQGCLQYVFIAGVSCLQRQGGVWGLKTTLRWQWGLGVSEGGKCAVGSVCQLLSGSIRGFESFSAGRRGVGLAGPSGLSWVGSSLILFFSF